jgi:NADPH2:quinone reductase
VKAIQFDRFGGPEVLEIRDVATPTPKQDEVRIRTSAIAVNFTDASLRSGLYPTAFPSGVGMDTVGVIEAVGEAVTGWRVGERVACSAPPAGAYAEARCVAQDRLLPAPADIPDDILVSVLMKGLTAHFLMRQTFEVTPGHAVLFHSAAGGVGSFATQWAKGLGATVIGAVGSDAKMQLAREAGCAEVVNTRDQDWPAKVRAFLGGRGVDVAYDCVGKDTFEGTVSCLAPRGVYVNFGMQSGPPPPVDLAAMRRRGSFYFTSPVGAHYTGGPKERDRAFAEILDAVRSGRVRIEVKHRFRLDQARQAHEALQSRATTGPIILLP